MAIALDVIIKDNISMITHKSKYAIGEIVFLITDVEQRDRIITQVLFL